jgi:hypothetical protein
LRGEQLDAAVQRAGLTARAAEARGNYDRRSVGIDRQDRAFGYVLVRARRPEVRTRGDEHALRVEDATRLGEREELGLVADRPTGMKRADWCDCASAGDADGNDARGQRRWSRLLLCK